jgi:hypothetical protein
MKSGGARKFFCALLVAGFCLALWQAMVWRDAPKPPPAAAQP